MASWFSPTDVPSILANFGSSSYELAIHFRVHSPLGPVTTCNKVACHDSSFEVSLLTATSGRESTYRCTCQGPSAFHPQRFSRSRWLTPLGPLRVCFAPLPRSGFPSQGFSLLDGQHTSSACSSPLAISLVRLQKSQFRRTHLTAPACKAPATGF